MLTALAEMRQAYLMDGLTTQTHLQTDIFDLAFVKEKQAIFLTYSTVFTGFHSISLSFKSHAISSKVIGFK
jgi:hypothetical protein